MFSVSRINPYSNGIRVELGSVGFGKLLVSLNPYSNGIRIELIDLTLHPENEES